MIFMNSSKTNKNGHSQNHNNNNNNNHNNKHGNNNNNHHPQTNQFSDLCTKLLGVIGTLCLIGGIGVLIYGIIANVLGGIISGSILIAIGLVMFGVMIFLFMKSNPPSSFYNGKQNNVNRIETGEQNGNSNANNNANANNNNNNNRNNNNDATVAFAVGKFDNFIKPSETV
jgi:hypothetical protein